MSPFFIPLLVPLLLAMFLAINMGGSGVAPAFAPAYGANLIKREYIPGLFGIFVFLGALLAGKEVTLTMGKDLLSANAFSIVITSIILFSVGASLLIANLLGIPQSTSQSAVLAIAGVATYLQGLKVDRLLYEIIPTWFILPLIAFFIMLLLSRYVFPYINRASIETDFDHLADHPLLRPLVMLSAFYVAFAIGANNVANAAGPVASMTMNSLNIGTEDMGFLPVMVLSVLIIAPCFAIGSSLLGYKVMKTTGKDIITIGPFVAMVISFLTATLLLLVSVTKGIPTSLVQLNTSAFIAYSISKNGMRSTFTNKKVLSFFIVWALAPAIAFGLAIGLAWFADVQGWLLN